MFSANTRIMNARNPGLVMIVILTLTACEGEQPQVAAETKEIATSAEVPIEQVGKSTAEVSTTGAMTFMVDGNEKSFEYLPESGSYYTRLASKIHAYPEAGSAESFSITFMSFDLKKLTYPTGLPLPRDVTKPMNPMAAMASVGFDYINAEGAEWAGPGKVQIESFSNDGVVTGTFDQVSLPHTDSELSNIMLTNGYFTARITSPW